ncbi:hypothetical protein OHB26_01895 [Nocardia sp. NBC_01503]|uniref:hypothetical protein n=1 Tax=Nocardia sp. NBC_01503 TaxID=2975997 RepID=UPI002E7C0946|nr:hypothetical protein [Nocardia sp. NBC_01503]WTL33033.1 hypothetical protein OHB26_01895 [Nocardia sp. NBC_01503]
MTTLLVVLIVWVVLSIPVALLLARMFRSTGGDARGRGGAHPRHDGHTRSPEEPELSRLYPEIDRRTGEFTSEFGAGEDDTHRVFPPR